MPTYNIKKNIFLILFLIVILGFFVIPPLTQAKSPAESLEVKYPQIGGSTVSSSSFPQYISYIAKLSILVSLAVFFVILAIASIRYITSTGNPPIMKDAKNQIIAALVGLGVVLSSYVILYTVNPELITLRFNNAQVPKINPTSTASITTSTLHNYNVIPVGQLIKEGIYGRDAMITASSTLNQIQKVIVRPGGINISADLANAKDKLKNFDWDGCMDNCLNTTDDCSLFPADVFCQNFCNNQCQKKKEDSMNPSSEYRSLELIEAIDKMIANVASNCKCEDPNSDCCQCHGSLCSSCCSSTATGSCRPKAGVGDCSTQPVGCPDAHCDTTTIKVLSHLLDLATGGTERDLKELDKLRTEGAEDPKFPKPPLHITKRFENGPDNIKNGLLQVQDIISNHNVTNYNSIIGVMESYGVKNVSVTPLDDWMNTIWAKNKSDPLSFYIDAGSYDPNYIPPYNPPNPPIVVKGKCSKEIDDEGIKMTLFCQCSDPWGNSAIGSESCPNQTMCKYGCVVTSLSMLFNYYGFSDMNTPGKALDKLKNDCNGCITKDDKCGSTNGDINWGPVINYLKDKYSFQLSRVYDSSLINLKTDYFDKETPILTYCTNFKDRGGTHFIVLRGYNHSTRGPGHSIVYIADPGWTMTSITEEKYNEYGCHPYYSPPIMENNNDDGSDWHDIHDIQ